MELQSIIDLLVSFGPGGTLAAICFYKWQKAEDRIEKMRDAFDLKSKEHYESLLAAYKVNFDTAIRVEGVLNDNKQVIATNTIALQAVVKGT